MTDSTHSSAAQSILSTTQKDMQSMPAEMPYQGPRLIQWLYKKAALNGHTKVVLARELGVTYGYIAQLSNGLREVHNISDQFARECAKYLGIPAVAVMLVSDKVTLLDFALPESSRKPVHQLMEGLQRISDDPLLGCLVPAEIWDAPDSVKALLIALYEDATQQEILPPRRLPALLQGLQEAALELAKMDADDYAQALVQATGEVH